MSTLRLRSERSAPAPLEVGVAERRMEVKVGEAVFERGAGKQAFNKKRSKKNKSYFFSIVNLYRQKSKEYEINLFDTKNLNAKSSLKPLFVLKMPFCRRFVGHSDFELGFILSIIMCII